MTFAGLLADAIRVLDRAGVPYMVTGSLASSYYGEPRATLDVDIVIDPSPDGLSRLVDELLAGNFYVDRGVATQALADRTQFNAVASDASKVDFIVRKQRAFSIEEFGRRESAELLGTTGYVTSPEDLVLVKLEWAADTDSERQLRDVARIVAVHDTLDKAYIDRWADQLGVGDAWRALRDERSLER